MAGRRRVGGSGWAGVHGSMIGVGGRGSGNVKSRSKRPKKPKLRPEYSGASTLPEARRAGLSIKQWREQSDKAVNMIERDLKEAKRLVEHLTAQLLFAEEARQASYKANDAASKTRQKWP